MKYRYPSDETPEDAVRNAAANRRGTRQGAIAMAVLGSSVACVIVGALMGKPAGVILAVLGFFGGTVIMARLAIKSL